MKPEISIVIPAIRTNTWASIYNSIKSSTHRNFELILVGPYSLPAELNEFRNIKHIRDFGSPVRCFNLGLLLCEAETLTYIADDGVFLPGMLDQAFDAFHSMPQNPKNALILKYTEGSHETQPDIYYNLRYAYPKVAAAQENWWIYNLTIMKTEYMKYLGGCDSQFETMALSHADLSIRAQRDGSQTMLFPHAIVHNTHGHADHTPIERGHVDHDEPLYISIHNNPDFNNRNAIDLNNWRNAPSVWTRRFG